MNSVQKRETVKFERYQIKNQIGEGGMGRVYSAIDIHLKRKVALKVMQEGDEQSRLRFLREIKTTAKLKHPYIVNIFNSGEKDGHPFFAMEYLDGVDFYQFMEQEHPSMRRIAEILAKVAKGIAYAHKNGVIHRDLKPENIMICNQEPKIVDFGLARTSRHSQSLSKSGAMMGTIQYMSPEQTKGSKISLHTDIYSIGVILYEALSGRLPFGNGSSTQIIRDILTKNPVPPSRIKKRAPAELEIICLKCLEKKSQNRYQNATELAAELERFINGKPLKTKRKSQFKNLRQKTLPSLFFGYIITVIAAWLILSSSTSVGTRISSIKEVYNYLDANSSYGKKSYDKIKTFNKHQYLVIHKYFNLQEAKTLCQTFKGHLVTITNKKEEGFIMSLMKEQQKYWTGGKTFFPTKSNENILFKKGKKFYWDQDLPSSNYYFICEWSPVNE
ncbi:protein kinase [Candidatus Uabimicrobium sp. HlEnr_7]|uniref:protein kinase domain-containing protein n=1 Tax=Candidatus Uabimicrobium helgolandensis TaxID=3095367 RepID=UPI003557DCD2